MTDQTNRFNVGRRYMVSTMGEDVRRPIRNKFVRRIFRGLAITRSKLGYGGSIARGLADVRRLRLAVERTVKSSHARRRLLAAELADRKART